MKGFYLVALCILFPFFLTAQGYQLEALPSDFIFPVDIANSGDGRLFIVEQRGNIYSINEEGTKNNTSFLNIGSKISFGGERGLLGMTFHPNFRENGVFYINYTDRVGASVISSFRVDEGQNSVSAATENILLRVEQPYVNHNGGCLKFGPDGHLYIGMGDGGNRRDPQNNGQDNRKLLGKMLRLQVDELGNASIPADNPFINESTIPDEIWATGLRNPWRFSFDRLTGDLWIADVGQDAFEEVNKVKAGEGSGLDFGWRCWEGNEVLNPTGCLEDTTFYYPLYTYANTDLLGKSVTGGFVYRGSKIPALVGKYIYGDYESGIIWSLEELPNGEVLNQQLYDHRGDDISSFGEDEAGELYVAGHNSGKIYRFKGTTTSNYPVFLNPSTLIIAPNPVAAQLMISFELEQKTSIFIRLNSLQGQLLEEKKIDKGFGQQQITMNTENLSRGSYILNITDGKSSITKKLIKL